MTHEIAVEITGSSVRFGAGVTREVGADLVDLGAKRVLVITDATLRRLPPVQTVLESLEDHAVAFSLYDAVRIEPNDASFADAIQFGRETDHDALVAVGGGSCIDTAKAVNLYTTYPPEDFLDYVNPPIGKGRAVPGALKPLMAIPTTAGTGSETTGVCVFDVTGLRAKTGISSRRLKPTLGLLDPDNTRTLPPAVAASAGLDILCHAVESYTATPFTQRPAVDRPSLRPPYQGSNPISDVWSLQALRMVAQFLVRAVEDPSDDEARANMLLAASVRRDWLWQRRRPSTACDVVSSGGKCEDLLRARLPRRPPAGAPWLVRDFERAAGIPFHGQRQPGPAPRGSRGSWCRPISRTPRGCWKHSGRPNHLVHATSRRAQRPERGGLHEIGHPVTGGRHSPAASTDDTVTPPGRN